MRIPSSNAIRLLFGATEYPYSIASPHEGVDFLPAPDNRIYAPFSGTVILKPNNGPDGNGLYMYNGKDQFHGLLHTSSYLVQDGQHVTEGDPVAIMGYSGYVVPSGPLGSHLHWCVKQNGTFINPLSLLIGGKGSLEEPITMPTDAQVDQVISMWNQIAYGVPASAAVFNNLRPQLKKDFFGTMLQLLKNADTAKDSLKNNQMKGNCTAEERQLLDLLKKVSKE